MDPAKRAKGGGLDEQKMHTCIAASLDICEERDVMKDRVGENALRIAFFVGM